MTVTTRYYLDTHVLAWISAGDHRLATKVVDLLPDPDASFVVSSVIAWEYADLRHRGRLAAAPPLDEILAPIEGEVIGFPPEAWRLASSLPLIHGDPVDRMLIAHVLDADAVLITYDAKIRRYPVATFG